MITYVEGHPSIKPHDPLIMWSFEITQQFKTIISPTLQCNGQQTLKDGYLLNAGPTHKSTRPFGGDTLVNYQKVYGHEIWYNGDIPWWAPNHKVIECFDQVVLQNHVTKKKHISTTKDPMATKLGKVITYVDGLIFTKSHDSLIMCSYEITWQTKSIVSNTAVLIATKLDRMVNYFKRLPPIK